MKKNWYLLGILSLAVIVLFSVTGCKNLKVDNLKANRYFKQANSMYENEQFEEAAQYYKEGLDLNPDAKNYYIYLGTSCSMAYQPGVLPPEQNTRYQNVEQTNQQLRMEIEEARNFVSSFESQEEFNVLLTQKAELEQKIQEAREALQMVTVRFDELDREIDYNKYTDFKQDLDTAQRRLKDNEAFFAQLEQEEETPEEDEEKTLAEIQEEWELRREIERRQKQLEKDRDIIQEDRFFVERFEQDPDFIEAKNTLAGYQNELAALEAELKAIPEYDLYLQKKDEIEYKTKEIEYNNNYKEEVVQNEELRLMAVEYLHKALEEAVEGSEKREKILTALSDLYSKMIVLDGEDEAYFKKAEEYRMKLLEKDPDDLNNYYVMAEFYKSHRKIDKVIETYHARIEQDPNDPEVYSRFSQFLGEARRWDKCIEMAKRRIYSLLNPDEIIPLTLQIDKNEAMREEAGKAQQYIDNIRKQRVLSSADKRRLINEQLEKMEADGLLTLDEIEERNAELQEQVDELFQQELDTIDEIADEELRKELIRAFYTLGVRHWNYSYYTDDLMLPREKREGVIEDGIKYLGVTLQLDAEYAEAIIYTSLLWREKTKVDPTKYETYRTRADELREEYTRLKEKQAKKAAAEISTEES